MKRVAGGGVADKAGGANPRYVGKGRLGPVIRSQPIFRKDRIVEGEQRWHAIGAVLRRGAALTGKQLAQFKRNPKLLAAARLDKEVYDWLLKYGRGYSTRINGILRAVMEGTR